MTDPQAPGYYDTWLREGGNGDVADHVKALEAIIARLTQERETLTAQYWNVSGQLDEAREELGQKRRENIEDAVQRQNRADALEAEVARLTQQLDAAVQQQNRNATQAVLLAEEVARLTAAPKQNAEDAEDDSRVFGTHIREAIAVFTEVAPPLQHIELVVQPLKTVLAQWDKHVSEGESAQAYRGMELAEATRAALIALRVPAPSSSAQHVGPAQTAPVGAGMPGPGGTIVDADGEMAAQLQTQEKTYLDFHKLAWQWVIKHYTSDGRSIHDGTFNIHAQQAVLWMADFAESQAQSQAQEIASLTDRGRRGAWHAFDDPLPEEMTQAQEIARLTTENAALAARWRREFAWAEASMAKSRKLEVQAEAIRQALQGIVGEMREQAAREFNSTAEVFADGGFANSDKCFERQETLDKWADALEAALGGWVRTDPHAGTR